jgi:hypothetical protein
LTDKKREEERGSSTRSVTPANKKVTGIIFSANGDHSPGQRNPAFLTDQTKKALCRNLPRLKKQPATIAGMNA